MGSFTKVKATFNAALGLRRLPADPGAGAADDDAVRHRREAEAGLPGLAFLIYLLPLIVQAVDDVDDIYLKTAYTLGAGTGQAVRKVLLAMAWPDIFQAMRLGFGVGWSYILLAEMVDIGRGLGGIIIVSQRRGPAGAHLPGAAGDRRSSRSSPTSSGVVRAGPLPVPGGAR